MADGDLAATDTPDIAAFAGLGDQNYAPDSTEAGHLGPTTLHPEGGSWEDFLHDVIAGITGLDPTLVRPRWQAQPPTTPAVNMTWCAFGVMHTDADYEPWIGHYDTPDPGLDLMQRMERQTVLSSFYGPYGQELAAVLRDGLFIDQNRAVFRANAVGIIQVDDIIRTADLFRQQFRERSDLNLILRREVRRTYNVRNLLRAQGNVIGNAALGSERTVTDTFDTDQVVEP